MSMEVVAAVDLAATIFSCLSFIFASFLCILLWRLRRKESKSNGKRPAILLTTHVYYMAICDVLIAIWCIFTYGPALGNFAFFREHPHDDEMNSLSFGSIMDNLPCFLLAILGQFAAIGSATWYIMISYCLWRILYGHNPLSTKSKSKSKTKLTVSPNKHLSNTQTKNSFNKRNLKFTKTKAKSYDNKYKITPVKEEESMEKTINSDHDNIVSANTFLNLPKTSSYSDRLLIHNSSNNSSVWSSWSNVDSVSEPNVLTFNKEHQIREKQDITKILRRHHAVVWTVTVLLTLIPFSTQSMGVDVSYIGNRERKLECWIGSKFWAFSFYSVISIAVLSAFCMLLFISFKILKKKYKVWWREYFKKKKKKKRDEIIKIYDNKGLHISLYGHNERGSTGGTSCLSSMDSNAKSSASYYKKETMILKRFGVFVGCYLLCWIIPILRRYYALFVDDERHVPAWLILGSEMAMAIFPMANAIVWYTNPSFRKLISKNLNFTIKYDCCCCCSREHKLSKLYDLDRKNSNTQLTHYDNNKLRAPMESKRSSSKQTPTTTGRMSGYTTPTYGSFCNAIDRSTYSHFSYPNKTHNKKNDNGLFSASSFPRFKGNIIGGSRRSSGDTDFNGYKNDIIDENDHDETTDDDDNDADISSGGTVDDIETFKKYSMEQLAAKFGKKKIKKYSSGDISFPPMIVSPVSGIVAFSSSFSEELKLENNTTTDGNVTSSNVVPVITQPQHFNNEYIKELAKHCYYGSDGSPHNIPFIIPTSQTVTEAKTNNNNNNSNIIKPIFNNTANKSLSIISNSNFVTGLFSDDEEYEDKLKRFKNSIVEFDEDYGIIEDESDDNMGNQINVNENHFGLPNDK